MACCALASSSDSCPLVLRVSVCLLLSLVCSVVSFRNVGIIHGRRYDLSCVHGPRHEVSGEITTKHDFGDG